MHRDVKPDNILIDKSCRVLFCDFGLSRTIALSDNESTMTGNIGHLESKDNALSVNNSQSASEICSMDIKSLDKSS